MKPFYFIFIGIVLLTSTSCFEEQEGCIDAVAVNFDVTADNNCCCAYPKLVLKMSHRYGDDGLRFGTNLLNDQNSPFELIGVQYYLSGFNFVDIDDNSFATTSTVSLPQLSGDDIETTDDIVLMTQSVFARPDTIGFFPTFGNYEKLEFEIGVKEVAQNTNPENVGATNPLATQSPAMWDNDEHYLAAKIILRPDTIEVVDTITIDIFENSLISLDGQLELLRAAHIDMNLRVDYSIWFEGIDFQNDSEQTISDKISMNLASSLSFF